MIISPLACINLMSCAGRLLLCPPDEDIQIYLYPMQAFDDETQGDATSLL